MSVVPRVIEKLHAFWQTLSQRHRLRFLEGFPEAEAVVAGSSGEGTAEGSDNLIRDLVIAPIAWCFEVRSVTVAIYEIAGSILPQLWLEMVCCNVITNMNKIDWIISMFCLLFLLCRMMQQK